MKGERDTSTIVLCEDNPVCILSPHASCSSLKSTLIAYFPYTHPTHVFNLGSHPSVSSYSTWPFLFNSSLPPCRAEALSLSPVGWWFASHLLLPLLEQTLSTWLIYLGATGFFYSFRKGINVLYIHSTSKLWGKAWWNWVSGSKSQQSKFSGAGFVWQDRGPSTCFCQLLSTPARQGQATQIQQTLLQSEQSSCSGVAAQTGFKAFAVLIFKLYFTSAKKLSAYFIWKVTLGDSSSCRSIPTHPPQKSRWNPNPIKSHEFLQSHCCSVLINSHYVFASACSCLDICMPAGKVHRLDFPTDFQGFWDSKVCYCNSVASPLHIRIQQAQKP